MTARSNSLHDGARDEVRLSHVGASDMGLEARVQGGIRLNMPWDWPGAVSRLSKSRKLAMQALIFGDRDWMRMVGGRYSVMYCDNVGRLNLDKGLGAVLQWRSASSVQILKGCCRRC